MDARVARGQVTGVRPHAPPERRFSGALHADPRAERETVARMLPGADAAPALPPPLLYRLIQQQQPRAGVVRDDDVDIAVVVEIAERGSAADPGAAAD